MTQNQINFFAQKEAQLHNRKTEALNEKAQYETNRHNEAIEKLQSQHNAIQEKIANNNFFIANRQLEEQSRHNLEQERLNSWYQFNMVNIDKQKLDETIRHQQATEQLSKYGTDRNFAGNMFSTFANYKTNAERNAIQSAALQETIVHNRTTEDIQKKQNNYNFWGNLFNTGVKVLGGLASSIVGSVGSVVSSLVR